jgi:hypothetical protein
MPQVRPELNFTITLTRTTGRRQAVFRAGEPRAHIFIVERGSVASRGRMLGPGGLMGLKLALLHGASDHGGGKLGVAAAAAEGSAVWDHTAVSLSYVNMLTLRCQDFDKCVSMLLRFASVPCTLRCRPRWLPWPFWEVSILDAASCLGSMGPPRACANMKFTSGRTMTASLHTG